MIRYKPTCSGWRSLSSFPEQHCASKRHYFWLLNLHHLHHWLVITIVIKSIFIFKNFLSSKTCFFFSQTYRQTTLLVPFGVSAREISKIDRFTVTASQLRDPVGTCIPLQLFSEPPVPNHPDSSSYQNNQNFSFSPRASLQRWSTTSLMLSSHKDCESCSTVSTVPALMILMCTVRQIQIILFVATDEPIKRIQLTQEEVC